MAALRNHVVGWSQAFAAASVERPFEGDAMAYAAGDDPAGDFRAAAADIVQGWRDHGMDREVTISGGSTPGAMVFNMTIMSGPEYNSGVDLSRIPTWIYARVRLEATAGAAGKASYSTRRPVMAREITSCWICSVPSKMSKILASRCQRSTGYSRT